MKPGRLHYRPEEEGKLAPKVKAAGPLVPVQGPTEPKLQAESFIAGNDPNIAQYDSMIEVHKELRIF